MKIAFRIFSKEIDELMNLYSSSLIAYEQTKKIKDSSAYFLEVPPPNITVENLSNYTSNVSSLSYSLRALILIRLISILERFLIDNIKFIFSETKEPFKTAGIIEFQYQELLSYKSLNQLFSKIISKECRQLSSAGFDKILKYYKQKFSLDLFHYCASKERLIEYHDRRHLFVHNLGRTDKQYRHKYRTEKLGLSISDNYIVNAINDIKSFAEALHKNTIEFIGGYTSNKGSSTTNSRTIWFSFQKVMEIDFIDDSFSFWSNDELVTLSDIILEKKNLSDDFIEIKVCGEKPVIKDYLSIVRNTYRSTPKIKNLNFLFDDYTPPPSTPRTRKRIEPTSKFSIPKELIKKVKEALPDKPWPVGIHKILATKLNMSNGLVYRIVRIITNAQK